MTSNVFEFGSLHFLQLVGTAMGTSAACMWATLYYACHEKRRIYPNYNTQLFYYKRFRDDIFAIWVGDDAAWNRLHINLNDFGILSWEIDELQTSVNFLDVTISITERGQLETRTYQKPMNLYLYLPPASCHPPGCIKGTIFGLVYNYFAQNTHRHDFVHFVALLFSRLIERGWTAAYLRPLFLAACKRAESRAKDPPPPADAPAGRKKDLFIHLQYHRADISRGLVRQL